MWIPLPRALFQPALSRSRSDSSEASRNSAATSFAVVHCTPPVNLRRLTSAFQMARRISARHVEQPADGGLRDVVRRQRVGTELFLRSAVSVGESRRTI